MNFSIYQSFARIPLGIAVTMSSSVRWASRWPVAAS